MKTVGDADGNHAALTVVLPSILDFERRAIEDHGGELEVEPALVEIRVALASSHSRRTINYTFVYTHRQAHWQAIKAVPSPTGIVVA